MKTRILLFIALLLMTLAMPTLAYSTNYTINGNEHVPIPQSYVYSHSINNLRNAPEKANAFFNQPSDLFIDKQDNLYVADNKNNRILKMTDSGETIAIFTQADGLTFNAPQGTFVDDYGDIYIADTGNSRIVQLKADGTFIKSFTKPNSDKLANVSVYNPTKIAVSNTGGLNVLMGENIMNIDSTNQFRGFIGQTDIGFDFMDWLLRIVASDEQKKVISKRTAASYDNFCLNDSGLIYATCRDTVEGQIKVLNSVGNNIYRKQGRIANTGSGLQGAITGFFTGNILGKPFRFGEQVLADGASKQPIFSDIAVDKAGIVSVIERQSGRIYQYDQTGNLLTVFGGLGSGQGALSIPVSLAVDSKGRLFVLDSSYGSIQVFEPTTFITLVQKATVLYNNGDYSGASAAWNEVMAIDETYPLAHYGLANTGYKTGDWQSAMSGYRYSNDRPEYSKAFSEYRYAFLKAHFLLVVACIAVLIVGLYFLITRLSRSSHRVLSEFEGRTISQLNVKNGFLMSISMLHRPGRTMDSLKNSRGRLNCGVAICILLLTLVARFFFIYTVHYPLQDIELQNVNWLLEVVKLIGPFLTWLIASYLLSSQFDGESTLSEIFVTSAYCMVPYVVVVPVAALLSHVLSTQESGLFALFVNGVVLWVGWLIFRSLRHLNDYSLGRTIAIALLCLLAMVLIWFIALLGYALVVRIIQFVQELFQEALLLTY